MKKQEKIFAVQDLTERLKQAKTIVLADFSGLTAPQINMLRSLIKKADGELKVVKNTLFSRALEGAKLPTLELTGPTAIVLAYKDELTPLKTVFDFAKTAGLPTFKSGIWEDRVLTREEVERLGSLPGRNELIGQLISVLSSPTAHLIQVLAGNQKKLIYILKAKTKPSFAEATEDKGGEKTN